MACPEPSNNTSPNWLVASMTVVPDAANAGGDVIRADTGGWDVVGWADVVATDEDG